MAACVILGSAFSGAQDFPGLVSESVATSRGPVTLHREPNTGGILLFRHGLPHSRLPNQIDYRAHALALKAVGCHALLVTSSVGVLDPSVPLYQPMLLNDLLMLENRLPDGSACTLFDTPQVGQGHLLVQGGLFHRGLGAWLTERCGLSERRLEFLYVQGPRTKTSAENRYAASLGAQVNSMTLAPEVILANELGLPTVGLVVGHKYSVPGGVTLDDVGIADSLVQSRQVTLQILQTFLGQAPDLPWANSLYRFEEQLGFETQHRFEEE
ncbi:MAG: 5'-methylthioadenosine phosphorylase [Cognaticolwellia sp.]|jgi:5'-methylthioadenosine phosphorylase